MTVLAPRHDFRALDRLENDRTRFTLQPAARREVLARLLKLKHHRAKSQTAQQFAAKSAPAKKGKFTSRKHPQPTNWNSGSISLAGTLRQSRDHAMSPLLRMTP